MDVVYHNRNILVLGGAREQSIPCPIIWRDPFDFRRVGGETNGILPEGCLPDVLLVSPESLAVILRGGKHEIGRLVRVDIDFLPHVAANILFEHFSQ